MTTNKPEVVMTLPGGEQLIRLSDYEALEAEFERLTRYCKNGIDCFANPCERHSGERTPPFPEFFEKYGGQCLICVVDNNKALQAECALLREQRNALAMHKIAAHQLIGIPASVGICEPIEGFAARPQYILPAVLDMALKIEALQADYQRLQAERDKLRSILIDLKDWDCDVRGGFLSIPVDLRRRMQEAIDAAMEKENKQ